MASVVSGTIGQVKTGTVAVAAPPTTTTPALTTVSTQAIQDLKTRFPALSWAFQIPELAALFSDNSIVSVEQLQAKIQDTNWWKSTAPAVRNWQARQQLDPEGANQDRRQKEAEVWDRYLQLGLKPNVEDVRQIAEQALAQQFNTNQLSDVIVSHLNYSPDAMQQIGAIQTTAQALMQKSKAYYINVTPETAFNWAKQVANGEKQATDFEPVMQQQARTRFAYSPEVTAALDAGVTVDDYFSPYKEKLAAEMEISPAAIDLTSDKWSDVIDHVDDKGVHRVMTYAEATKKARSQDEWFKTQKAQDMAATYGETLLKTFGKVA